MKKDNFEDDELIYDIQKSTHIECKVTVSRVIDSHSFEFVDNTLGTIKELEENYDFIEAGNKLSFVGSLQVDFLGN